MFTDRPTTDAAPIALAHSWARMRGAQLSAGYTVNTYSKPALYDASKGNDVWFSKRAGLQKTSALGKPDVDLFIARTDTRHDLPPTNQPANQPAKVTVSR